MPAPEMAPEMEVAALAAGIRAGDRRILARAITLAESERDDHRRRAEALLTAVMDATGRSIRIGISGPPGVGKSTFIEAYGHRLTGDGGRLAVLAIDPSSRRSGGSILGDKTRMEGLARDPAAFVRPSPAGTTLGGVARRTADAILLCEAAGFDTVLVETVGVGQSETAVADIVDMVVLLLAPGGGDELQGIKRGIVEIADLLVVNKADGALAPAAAETAQAYRAALSLLRPESADWTPPIVEASAVTPGGTDAVAAQIARFRVEAGRLIAERRSGQAVRRLWAEIGAALKDRLRRGGGADLARIEAAVAAGEVPVGAAARRVVDALFAR